MRATPIYGRERCKLEYSRAVPSVWGLAPKRFFWPLECISKRTNCTCVARARARARRYRPSAAAGARGDHRTACAERNTCLARARCRTAAEHESG